MRIDWGAGRYEDTAAELEPVAEAVMAGAALGPGDIVVDIACGTGNAALLAAAADAEVIGVDGAPRLLEVARQRARERGLTVEFREGDLLALPLEDNCADVVLSVFGVIFAADPGAALREVKRVMRPGGRAFIAAWIPTGPIDGMLTAAGEVLGRATATPPPQRFAWFDPEALAPLAAEAGLSLVTTTRAQLAIRDASVSAYLDRGRAHPMALATRGALEQAGVEHQAYDAMAAVLDDANEDPAAFLVHSPYVIHELRAG